MSTVPNSNYRNALMGLSDTLFRPVTAQLSGTQGVLVAIQVGLAGLAFGLGVDQALAWWRERAASLRWMALTTFALVAVLAANVAVVTASAGWPAEVALLGRALALSATAVLTVMVASSVGGLRTPRWLLLVVVNLAALRIVLWVGTDLMYAHRWSHGVPVYGPLLVALNMPLMALAFGYLLLAVLRGGTKTEQFALVAGASATVVIGAFSMAMSDKVGAELATGFAVVPLILAGLAILADRLAESYRAQCMAQDRQGALADLSHQALTRSLYQLCDGVEDAVRWSLPAERCEVTLDPTAVSVVSAPGRIAVPVPGSFGPNGAVSAVRDEPFDADDLAFLEAVAHLLGGAHERYRAEDRIRHQALHDELTGLANRMLIRDRLANAVSNASRTGERVAVMLLDLDGFKSINDLHGHPAGDCVLTEMARSLSGALREGQTLGRFGGDEFVVISEGVADDEAVADIAARLLVALRTPLAVPSGKTRASGSIGIAVSSPGDDADSLIRDADIAMHRAKERGGDTAEVFNPALRRQVLKRVEVQEALTFAVELGEIVAYYQPIVHLETGRVVRLEALARWRRNGELVEPNEWVPIAEQTGAIDSIGCEMLRQATAQLSRWLEVEPELIVAVNVSPRQLSSPELVNCVEEAVAMGLPPDRLCLEVTEGIAVDDGVAIETMQTLRSMGCQIALDDFGVGYSSLAALGRLPIDVVKIDQAFVRRLSTPDGPALVAAVVTLARALGLVVIAEGIETEAQRETLIELGCKLGQGYLIARPGPPEEVRPPLAR